MAWSLNFLKIFLQKKFIFKKKNYFFSLESQQAVTGIMSFTKIIIFKERKLTVFFPERSFL